MRKKLRRLNGQAIHWRAEDDVIHSCEAAEVHPGLWLIWTDCERDVPSNKAYRAPHTEGITCPACAAALAKSE